MAEKEFLSDLKKLVKKHSDVAKIQKKAAHKKTSSSAKPAAARRCVRWGVNPKTGEVVCTLWKEV